MINRDYWLSEYVSISKILKAAPAKYTRAFLYVETDENDVTYFILNQLSVFIRAMDQLYAYLGQKAMELQETRILLDGEGQVGRVLNHRQLDLVRHALRHPGYVYTFSSHLKSHNISYQTARTDLLGLEEKDLLVKGKTGQTFIFEIPQDLHDRLLAISPDLDQ